ncbi:MAG: DUF222 domain-containing protein [Candidatus Microbacterium colombiense]|nr:MAG: DUF222 domain-containing protein [Microbacterium sp.]
MTSTSSDEPDQRAALLDAWVEKRRQIARLESESAELLADRLRLRDADARENPYHRDTIHRSMVAEYSAAGRVAQGSIEYAFSDAAFLDSDHPASRASFRTGAITAAHVREIVRAGSVVREAVREGRADAAALGFYDTAAAVAAEQETPARTRSLVRQIAAALSGDTLVDRHRRALSERRVTMRSVDDGLALLTVVLPEHLAAAIVDRLTQLARQVIATRDDIEPKSIFGSHDTFATDPLPDARTIDQVRTDLLTDLLLAADPSEVAGAGIDRVQAHIQVTVAASTLIGADDRPAELDGFGPIDPDIARDLAGRNGGWSRLFLDPSGMVTETDTYSPTEGMRRFLRARDQHCRFPGCRMPVRRCQIDHNHDHARGGRTSLRNLSHFCTGHHVLKHPDLDERHRWTARQLPDGTLDWVSPLGRHYGDPPPRRVMFV